MNTNILVFSLLFLDDKWMKKANNFQIAKIQPEGAAWLLLDFLPISAWRCL